jgi:hypothetical protein
VARLKVVACIPRSPLTGGGATSRHQDAGWELVSCTHAPTRSWSVTPNSIAVRSRHLPTEVRTCPTLGLLPSLGTNLSGSPSLSPEDGGIMSRSRSQGHGNSQRPPGMQLRPPNLTVTSATRRVASHRHTIFISYSHRDRRWVDRLLVHLKPLERDMSIDIWEDSRIKPGTRWYSEIKNALNDACVAILMVSADFLASDFVMNEEVSALLRSAETCGTVIMPVIIAPSLFSHSSLNCFQSVNSPATPLSKLSSHQRDEVLVRLATSINAVIH